MSESKKTPFLEEMIAAAKKIGDTKNPPLTAERFFVAMIDRIQESDGQFLGGEQMLSFTLTKKILGDLAQARETLMRYILEGSGQSFLDDLYMKNKLHEAAEASRNFQDGSIYTPNLILAIRKDPTATIRAIMANPPAGGETKKASAGGTSSIVDSIQSMHNQQAEAPKKPAAPTEEEEPQTPATSGEEEGAEGESNFDELVEMLRTAEEEEDGTSADKTNISQLVDNVKNIRSGLQGVVYGQDNAINVFSTGYFQSNMLHLIDKSRRRPKATFLFAGPPGVGKTFLAEQVADALKLPFCRFDMSEYADKESHLEFAGSDKVYKNGKVGNVTSFVAKNPECVLLFDEIEKRT